MHGKGHLLNSAGDLYVSPFIEGYSKGTGTVYFANGDYFFGKLEQGDLESGKMVYADGTVYVGDFRNKKRNGKGSSAYKDGSKYEGNWVNDKEHGEGRLIIQGIWNNGIRNNSAATPQSPMMQSNAVAQTPANYQHRNDSQSPNFNQTAPRSPAINLQQVPR